MSRPQSGRKSCVAGNQQTIKVFLRSKIKMVLVQCESAVALNVDGSLASWDDMINWGCGHHQVQAHLLLLPQLKASGGGNSLRKIGRRRPLDKNLRLNFVLAGVELVEPALQRFLPRNPFLQVWLWVVWRGGLGGAWHQAWHHQRLEPVVKFGSWGRRDGIRLSTLANPYSLRLEPAASYQTWTEIFESKWFKRLGKDRTWKPYWLLWLVTS